MCLASGSFQLFSGHLASSFFSIEDYFGYTFSYFGSSYGCVGYLDLTSGMFGDFLSSSIVLCRGYARVWEVKDGRRGVSSWVCHLSFGGLFWHLC